MQPCSFGRFCRLDGTVYAGQAHTVVGDRATHLVCAEEARLRFEELLSSTNPEVREQIAALIGRIDQAISRVELSNTGSIDVVIVDPTLN